VPSLTRLVTAAATVSATKDPSSARSARAMCLLRRPATGFEADRNYRMFRMKNDS